MVDGITSTGVAAKKQPGNLLSQDMRKFVAKDEKSAGRSARKTMGSGAGAFNIVKNALVQL